MPTLALRLSAGTPARAGPLRLPLVIAVVTGGRWAGDALAHRTGHLPGRRLRHGRPPAAHIGALLLHAS
ncbi:hypothetical protein ACIQ8D_31290 [Streptomyces sp. NPDC096094]|uniref:hypothetical protein n=1 Tax=Streptomyces sp. NPDC096094 TaxID=3366073 RepID=UPI003807407E